METAWLSELEDGERRSMQGVERRGRVAGTHLPLETEIRPKQEDAFPGHVGPTDELPAATTGRTFCLRLLLLLKFILNPFYKCS